VIEEREELVEGLEEVGMPTSEVLAKCPECQHLAKTGVLHERPTHQIDAESPVKYLGVEYGVTSVVRTGGGNLPSSVGLGEAVV
jgi:hypothetical protein